ncbi:putative P-loop containing nucleoside triphosphate hydrolase [Arabidopsis thaliana]
MSLFFRFNFKNTKFRIVQLFVIPANCIYTYNYVYSDILINNFLKNRPHEVAFTLRLLRSHYKVSTYLFSLSSISLLSFFLLLHFSPQIVLKAPQLVFKLFPSQRPSPRLAVNNQGECRCKLGVPEKCFCGKPVKLEVCKTGYRQGDRVYKCPMLKAEEYESRNHLIQWWDQAVTEELEKHAICFGVIRETIHLMQGEIETLKERLLAKEVEIDRLRALLSTWRNEADMIEKIATDVSNMLNSFTPSRDFDGLVGMRAHMDMLEQLLRLDLDEVRIIGIWGPPGIGKTTIARFLLNQVSDRFQLSAIMVNIKGCYPRPCFDEYSAQLQLQNQMLSQMINHKDIMISHLGVAQERLRDKKVFLVLDEVDQLGQLDALAKETRWFGPGSRIIKPQRRSRSFEGSWDQSCLQSGISIKLRGFSNLLYECLWSETTTRRFR